MAGIHPAVSMRSEAWSPSAAAAVLAGGAIDVYFEIYNLDPDASGLARYATRYTLSPRQYAVEYARLISSGESRGDLSLRLGAVGRSLGGVTLAPENYSDVFFPATETRVEKGGRRTASTRVDSAGLRPGLYAQIVTVTDLSSGSHALAQAPLAILSAEDVAKILRP